MQEKTWMSEGTRFRGLTAKMMLDVIESAQLGDCMTVRTLGGRLRSIGSYHPA